MSEAPKPLYLALDQGTHASRAIVFDAAGAVVMRAERPVALRHPTPEHIEQEPEELVASVSEVASEALAARGAEAVRVAAAGLATQRSTVVCWDAATGAPLSPAISWQDRRAWRAVERLAPHAAGIQRSTGLPLTPHYGASKLAWCLEHLPAVRAARDAGRLCWGPLAAFLVFRLTSGRSFLVDHHNASRTQLWNLHTRNWDAGLLARFGLPAGHLPECAPTLHPYGNLVIDGAGVPLQAVNGDQAAALFGAGWPDAATATINVGTGAFVQRPTERPPQAGTRLLAGLVLQAPGRALYVLEGTVNGAGAALDWLAEQLPRQDLVARLPGWLARTGDPPLFLNGVGGVGSPFWAADMPSRFLGAGDAAAQAVAVVESIVFMLQANLEAMAPLLPPPTRIRLSGGLARLDGLCGRLAALTGLPVVRRDDPEATARGTAFALAGFPDTWRAPAPEARFDPRPDPALAARYRHWREAMARATGY